MRTGSEITDMKEVIRYVFLIETSLVYFVDPPLELFIHALFFLANEPFFFFFLNHVHNTEQRSFTLGCCKKESKLE